MTVSEIYKEHGIFPSSFTIGDEKYECTTMQHSDGTWYAYTRKMNGLKRERYDHQTGLTEKEAIEKLIINNSNP